MNTQEIIEQLTDLKIEHSEDYDKLDLVDELTELLRKNSDGYLACQAMIDLLERHPTIEFGTPGEPIHTIEKYQGHYENILFQSLDRCPTQMTLWMLNRIINAEKGENKNWLLKKLKSYMEHPNADFSAKEIALHFYQYQIEKIVDILKSIIAQNFKYYKYHDAIKKVRMILENSSISAENWCQIKHLIGERLLPKGAAFALVAYDGNLSLDEDSEQEAYKWLDIFVKNIESKDVILEY